MLRRESGIRQLAHENIGKMHWRLGITVEAEKSFKEDLRGHRHWDKLHRLAVRRAAALTS